MSGEPAFEPQRMMVELPDDIPRLAGQQPRLEGDKGQRMVGLYHCTWRRARLRIQAGRDIQRHHGAVVVRWWMSAATGSRGALRRPVPSRPSIISEISSGHGMVAAWITPPA